MTEIGHGLHAQSIGAPVAEARPRRFSVHGKEVTDSYAWLKAENWQTVLKDPAALPKDIAAYLKAENAFSDALARINVEDLAHSAEGLGRVAGKA